MLLFDIKNIAKFIFLFYLENTYSKITYKLKSKILIVICFKIKFFFNKISDLKGIQIIKKNNSPLKQSLKACIHKIVFSLNILDIKLSKLAKILSKKYWRFTEILKYYYLRIYSLFLYAIYINIDNIKIKS